MAEAKYRGPQIARCALWALVFVLLMTGVILVVSGGFDVWKVDGNTSTFVERVDTRGIGASSIAIGVVVLAATLICEIFLPHRARLTIPESARLSLRLHDKTDSSDVVE